MQNPLDGQINYLASLVYLTITEISINILNAHCDARDASCDAPFHFNVKMETGGWFFFFQNY